MLSGVMAIQTDHAFFEAMMAAGRNETFLESYHPEYADQARCSSRHNILYRAGMCMRLLRELGDEALAYFMPLQRLY